MRAVALGGDDSNLEIAKHYLNAKDSQTAIVYLERVCQSDQVSEASTEEAKRLLKKAMKNAASVTNRT